ncbi:MAG TPA: SusD/RagB family nutrient-binding outer membrane lipoprotein [Ohtaekwangia sp.]
MKKLIAYKFIVVFMFFSIACDEGFDELNTPKTSPTFVDPIFLLNNALVNLSPTGFAGGSTLVYDYGVVQQIISPVAGVVTGANFNKENRAAGESLWQNYYRNVIRYTKDVIYAVEIDEERSNLYHMSRILQAYAFMVLTDTYGEIPYYQGGMGYIDQVFFLTYDTQEEIYDDIIKELTEATTGLNAARKIETSDALFSGNVDQWKKFGYSLLLRAGMRLSKVAPTKAEDAVQAAYAGGVILLNTDNVAVKHDNSYRNPVGVTLNSTEAGNFYLAAPFVEYLQDTEDPRLKAIAVRYPGATSSSGQAGTNPETTVPADQVGLPMGQEGGAFYSFSQVDRKRMAKQTSPYFIVTAAQNYLLLAEARERGWITDNDTKYYFDLGVTMHMLQLGTYDPGSAVDPADIETYLQDTDTDFDPANALEQINTQYWIASFLNGPEAFANFRRSGYPELAPNPYVGQDIDEDFIRRLQYPNSEVSSNSENMGEAVGRMGGESLDTRVWWDVE